ncbi:hypothetical protein SAMN05444166_4305 [Singulisphaera sp. GP187]|nr:hypothetical protein SAMN05444166_4305 [Singulisphaera sp. GP187]
MDRGGPDNLLVRGAKRQEALGLARPEGTSRPTGRLLRLRRPDKQVVRATRGRAEYPVTWRQSRFLFGISSSARVN